MRVFRATAGLLALFVVSGCDDDPTEPCDRDLACAVAGVDIAILDVEPQWTSAQEYDATLGMRVVQPGDEIEVEVLVMNRGTIDASHPATLHAYLRDNDDVLTEAAEIEPLDVGERATYTLRFEIPTGPRFLRWPGFPPGLDSIGRFEIIPDGYVDADTTNDARAGFAFHVDAPVLEFRLDGLPDTIRTQTSYDATLFVENHSQTRAFAGGLDVELCADPQLEVYCWTGSVGTFTPTTIGPIPAGVTIQRPITVRLTANDVWWFDSHSVVAIAPCVPLVDDLRSCIHPSDFDPSADYGTTVLPDLVTECDPPGLADGDFFDVAAGLCAHNLDDDFFDRTYGVAWFHGAAGECWRAAFTTSSVGTIAIRDADLLEPLASDADLTCRRVVRTGAQLVIVRATPGATPSGTILLQRIE